MRWYVRIHPTIFVPWACGMRSSGKPRMKRYGSCFTLLRARGARDARACSFYGMTVL